MRYTPGPWVIREPDLVGRAEDIAEGVPPEDQELTEVYAEDSGNQVCYVMNDTPDEMYNAHLISAAPDLLEALRFFVELDADGSLHIEGSSATEDPVITAAKAAIAKAEGRSE